MNQVILVGKVINKPTLVKNEKGLNETVLKVVIIRKYKNKEGNYESDIIDVILFSGIAEATVNYVKEGNTVGLVGRLQQKFVVLKDESIISCPQVMCEKITFIKGNNKEEKGIC